MGRLGVAVSGHASAPPLSGMPADVSIVPEPARAAAAPPELCSVAVPPPCSVVGSLRLRLVKSPPHPTLAARARPNGKRYASERVGMVSRLQVPFHTKQRHFARGMRPIGDGDGTRWLNHDNWTFS